MIGNSTATSHFRQYHTTPPPSPEPADHRQIRKGQLSNYPQSSLHQRRIPDDYGGLGGPTRRPTRPQNNFVDDEGRKAQASHSQEMGVQKQRFSHLPHLKTFNLSRDLTIDGRSPLATDAFGFRLVHGEIPGTFGRYGCVISHIFAGSLIETIGDIHEGDEVVQINGIPMGEKSDEEIQLIVGTIREEMELTTRSFSTKNHAQVESTLLNGGQNRAQGVEFGSVNQWCFEEESWPGPRTGQVSAKKAFEDDVALLAKRGYRTTNMMYDKSEAHASSSGVINTPWGKIERKAPQNKLGMIELQILFDYNANILYVTIIQAKNLKTMGGNVAKPDAFILGYLLPQRTLNSMRKTCFVMESSSPFWNQTFVYPNLTLRQLRTRHLEITAWSYNRNFPNEFLGEITLDLSDPSLLDEKGHWFQLMEGQPSKPSVVNGPTVSAHRLAFMHRS